MPKYMKAYLLGELRRFPNWHERRWQDWVKAHEGDETPPARELGEDDVVFIQEDGVVTKDVFGDGDVVFDDVTPEWLSFCSDTLAFSVPDWEAESVRVREEIARRLAQEPGGRTDN
jgi:hypothetical protein